MPRTCATLWSIALLALTASTAQAEIAFDSFGPNFTYDANLGFVVGVDGFGVNSIGVRFTSEATGLFSTLWIAANAKDGTPNDGLVYSLKEDENGTPDGPLESVVFDDICFTSQCLNGQVYSASGAGTTLLTAGEQYWLVATVADPESGFFWFASPPGEGPGTVWVQNDLFPEGTVFEFAQPPVFRIDVMGESPGEAPEPPALLLIAAILTLVGVQRAGKVCAL